ncbi:hypothetical protein [Lacticaseibacillus saniviri]
MQKNELFGVTGTQMQVKRPIVESAKQFSQYMMENDCRGLTLEEYKVHCTKRGIEISIVDERAIVGDKSSLKCSYQSDEFGRVQRIFFPV